MTTWQGNVGVPGGTAPSEQIFVTLTASSAHTDIENAITNASAKAATTGVQQVVMLGAGTYSSLGGTIRVYSPHHVTLRGAGVGQTILTTDTGTAVVYEGTSPWITEWPAGATVNSGSTKGSTSIGVSTAANIVVGKLMILESPNVTNKIFGLGNGSGTNPTNNSSGRLRDGNNVLAQCVLVTSISGNTVNFTPALNDNFPTPTAYGFGGKDGAQFCGVENLTINGGTGNGQDGLYFEGCYACWAKNIEVTNYDGWGVELFRNVSLEIRDSYIHDPQTFSVNHGYAMQFDHDNNCLIENNLFYKNQEGLLIQGSSSGNVIGYNCFYRSYDVYNTIQVQQASLDGNHTPYPWLNLFEGNYADSFHADFWYGPSASSTVVRNYIAGTDPDVTMNRVCINLDAHNWNYNIVGNILGSSGTSPSNTITLGLPKATVTYANTTALTWSYGTTDQTSYSNTLNKIFRLGYPNLGNNASTGWLPVPDATTNLQGGDTDVQAMAATPAVDGNYTLIHGNWDKANGKVTYDSSITDHIVPNSYYLTSKPTFFGNLTWPAFEANNGEAANPAAALQLLPAGYRLVTGNSVNTAAQPVSGPTVSLTSP